MNVLIKLLIQREMLKTDAPPKQSLTVFVISLSSSTMVLHMMERDCQEQMGCTRPGQELSTSKVDLVTS